jgi:hypothetical protein
MEVRMAFVAFMESLYLQGLDLTREPDHGRDMELWFLDHQPEQDAD